MRRTGDPQREKCVSETAQTGYDTSMQVILRECGYSDELPAGHQTQGEVVVAPSEHGSFLRSKLNAKDKAFKEILTDLHKTLQMSALPDISDDMTGNELVTVYKSTKLVFNWMTIGLRSCLSWTTLSSLPTDFLLMLPHDQRTGHNLLATVLEPPKEDLPCKEEMKMSELDIRIKFSWSVPSCGEAIYYSYQYSLTSIFYYFILTFWVYGYIYPPLYLCENSRSRVSYIPFISLDLSTVVDSISEISHNN